MTDPIRALLAKADRSLKSARRSFDEGPVETARAVIDGASAFLGAVGAKLTG